MATEVQKNNIDSLNEKIDVNVMFEKVYLVNTTTYRLQQQNSPIANFYQFCDYQSHVNIRKI